MLPKYHIFINLIISLILLIFINPIYVLIFFLSSFLIDADHYLYYYVEKKHISIRKAYRWFIIEKSRLLKLSREERKKHMRFFLIFHGIEPVLILFLLSKFYYPFFFIFLGFFAHLIEDFAEWIPLDMKRRKLSLTYALYTHFQIRKLLKKELNIKGKSKK